MTATLPHDTVERAVAIRREIHRYPELGFEEENAGRIVERELAVLGIEHRRVVGTGVVGIVRGGCRAASPACAPTWTRCRSLEGSGEPFVPRFRARCTPAGTTRTPPCCSARRACCSAARATLHGTAVLLFQPAEEGPGRRAADDRGGRDGRSHDRRGRDAARRRAPRDRHDRLHAGRRSTRRPTNSTSPSTARAGTARAPH